MRKSTKLKKATTAKILKTKQNTLKKPKKPTKPKKNPPRTRMTVFKTITLVNVSFKIVPKIPHC